MIVLLAAVVVVCTGVVVVAVGRGGQIAEFTHDAPPLGLPARRPIAGTDVALLRLPVGPWGYSFRSTDDALRRIAHALTERDTRIAVLEQQVAELRATQPADDDSGSPWFDRSATFEGRPARPALGSGVRPAPSRTSEPAAIAAPPADDEATDAKPIDAEPEGPKPVNAGLEDAKPEDSKPEDGSPQDDVPVDTVAAKPEEDEPVDDEPEAPAAGSTAVTTDEPDEDWVFEDDVEPVVEPLDEAGVSTPTMPSPGDRLVASSRLRADDDATDEKADTTVDTDVATDVDAAEEKADEKADDASADREPRGEGH